MQANNDRVGLIDGSDDPYLAKYPVYEPHLRIPLRWLKILHEKATSLEKDVFLGLMEYMDWETLKCCPTIRQLAKVINKDIRLVHKGLQGLKTKGIIAIEKLKVAGKYGRPPNEYTILLGKLRKHYKSF